MNNSTFAYLTFKQRQAVIRMCGKETPCNNCLILAKCSQVCNEFTNFLDRKIEEHREFRNRKSSNTDILHSWYIEEQE